MRLSRVEITDFRSVFADEKRGPFGIELASGSNTLVGPNNCGKSNVLRAIALALDPYARYDPSIDNPGPRAFAHPVITLRFDVDRDDVGDRKVIETAQAYEGSLGAGSTFAEAGQVLLRVTFEPSSDGPRRKETLLTPNHATPTQPEQFEAMASGIEALRERVRFVLINSGESIKSVLEGNFREILHSVVRDKLAGHFDAADDSRTAYLDGITESLLKPLRDRLETDLGELFPEIEHAILTPSVPTIEQTLSEVNVSLEDLVVTPLSEKGTGVRGGVLVAMLSYLATNATRHMILAVEEPEAFLHPASQEDLRDRLDQIAEQPDVTLLVTTHSPFVTTRSDSGRVFGLAKDRDGRTRISESISGDDDHSRLVGALFRDSTFEDLLKSASDLPDSAKGVLLVEGEGDRISMELAARVVGRPDLLDGIHIRAAGGATKLVATAVIAKASTDKPVLVLLDNDENGKRAKDTLVGSTFGFQNRKEVLTYAEVFPNDERNFPYEAEDLFDPALIGEFVDAHGESIVDGTRRRPDDEWHYDLGSAAKETLGSFLEAETQPGHVSRWIELILLIRDLLGLDNEGLSVEAIIDSAPSPGEEAEDQGRAMIVTAPLDYPHFRERGLLVMDTTVELPPDVSRIGFYQDGEIKPEFPAIRQHYPSIRFSAEVVDQLRATGSSQDELVADIIEGSLRKEDQLANETHQLVLLSEPDDEDTLKLDESIVNTKEISGRRVAWAVSPRFIHVSSLMAGPKTTTDLDGYEAGGNK